MPVGETGDAERFDSFDALVAAYEKRIFNVVYRMLGDYDEAADVTQEAFINAFRGFERFRGESGVYTWLYQIALNACRNRIRKRRRSSEMEGGSLDAPVSAGDDGETATREVADSTFAPHDLLESKEMRERVMAAMESLPAEYREVVVLRELQQLSYNEIVAATGLSLDNVKTRLSRARAMLRRKLEPYRSG